MADATQASSHGAAAPQSPGGGSHESGDQSPRSSVREQDRFLPIANISRIMKKALPANGKIAKDAKETVQECVSEFISFITSEASDKCQREKRKTINGDDLLWAMATLGFEDYIDPLKVYLTRYREMEGDTKGSAKGADGSARRDGVQLGPSSQLAHQGSFSQGMNYGNSQGGCGFRKMLLGARNLGEASLTERDQDDDNSSFMCFWTVAWFFFLFIMFCF